MARETGADRVYVRLRHDILTGRLRPDERLSHAELCAYYDVGVGVLREALPRLVERGLAVKEAGLGFRVVSVSADDLKELTDARISIETLVVRASIESGDVAWEATVLAAHHQLSRAGEAAGTAAPTPAWIEQHVRFHQALLAACPNRRLLGIAEKLRDAAEIYQCWAQSKRSTGLRVGQLAEEHRLLADLAIARDAPKAADALADHIQRTADALTDAHHATQSRSRRGAGRSQHDEAGAEIPNVRRRRE
jgi:DNA-binding GntR family transcriptional regulator